MPNFPKLNFIQEISKDLEYLNEKYQKLLKKLSFYLGIKPIKSEMKFTLSNINSPEKSILINFGIKRQVKDQKVFIRIYNDYKKFLEFIVLRELLILFVDKKFWKNNSIILIVNQIVMQFLVNHPLMNQWRSKIWKIISQNKKSTILSDEYYQLESIFNNTNLNNYPNPSQFFFQYLNKYGHLFHNTKRTFSFILFKNYQEMLQYSLYNDNLIETLRILTLIFYKSKNLMKLQDYKNSFTILKNQNILETHLSFRRFIRNLRIIQNKSFIIPSYQINWASINIAIIIIFIEFNSNLNKNDVLQFINEIPFFVSPKSSMINFSVMWAGYFVIPFDYVNDCIKFIKMLKEKGVIVRFKLMLRESHSHFINLNYFKETFNKKVLLNPNHSDYRENLEINFFIETAKINKVNRLSILEFLVLDRIRSYRGLGFENKAEYIKIFRSDLFKEILNQRNLINDLKKNLKRVLTQSNLKERLIELFIEYQKEDFFSIKRKISSYLEILKYFGEDIENRNYTNIEFLKNKLKNKKLIPSIEFYVYLKDDLLNDFLTTFFENKETFNEKSNLYKTFLELLNSFAKLKIFNLNTIRMIINDEKLINQLFLSKERKLSQIYNKYKIQDINLSNIEVTINSFIDSKPPIIKPLLISTINTKKYEKDYFQLLIKGIKSNLLKLNNLKKFFPRILIDSTIDFITEEKIFYVEISLPPLNKTEKNTFISILLSLFGSDDIYFGRNLLWSGFFGGIKIWDFYDVENKNFFYTKDLFNQFTIFANSIFKANENNMIKEKFQNFRILFSNNLDLIDFIDSVNKRKLLENESYNLEDLNLLYNLNQNLEEVINENEKLVMNKKVFFFKNHVKNLSFFPAYHRFGLQKYITYFFSNNLNKIEFKNILNNILKVRYPACIGKSIPFLLESVLPIEISDPPFMDYLLDPNLKLLEFCSFFIKRTIQIFHFEGNYTPQGLDYQINIFKRHIESILFEKNYEDNLLKPKVFDFSIDKAISEYSFESPEFNELCEIFSYHSIDIKSYIGTKKVKTVERIQNLLKKKLIFPYIKLKNLGFQESIYFIIPNLNQDSMETLMKIFGWFNYGFIHEIEGIYFIQGFEAPIDFEYGLMMEIYFPKCELAEFKQLFDMVFEYLDIEHYLILKDFVNGDTLVKNVYEDPNFFDHYHPLRNVKYNGKDHNK
jgi:hypothetical protein